MRELRARPALRPGQEWVWDYPRPPWLEPVPQRVRVQVGDVIVADSTRALRVLETSHPPAIYIPPADVRAEHLQPTRATSWCEWKGRASYYDLQIGERRIARAAWYYPEPNPAYLPLRGYLSFYPQRVDACFVGDERVQPQAGEFYGGWITTNVVGPFKGGPDTAGW